MFNLEPLQHLTLPYTGTPVTQTFSYNVLQQPLPPLSAGHAHTVGLQITILKIVIFILMLYPHLPMNINLPLVQSLLIGTVPSQ